MRLLTATLLVKLALEIPTALLLAHGQNELCGFAETAMATGDTAALGAGLKVLATCLLLTAYLLSTCFLLDTGLKVLSTLWDHGFTVDRLGVHLPWTHHGLTGAERRTRDAGTRRRGLRVRRR